MNRRSAASTPRGSASALVAIALLAMVTQLGACVHRPSTLSPDLNELVQSMVGDYQSAPSDGAREGRPIHLRIRRIESSTANTLAFYSEMRHDGPDGELYRQRLYQFDAHSRLPLLMQALSFTDPKAAAGLIADPSLLRKGALTTQASMEPGCETRWRRTAEGFLGVIDPATCVITGKRGDQRRIEGQTLFSERGVGQLERGYDLSGKLLFGNPTGELYFWPRVSR